jgi:hypothetical protein
MILLDWYRQYLEIKYNSRKLKNEVVVEEKVCASCETLKQQLEVANYEKAQLLSKILKEPEPVKETQAPTITRPVRLPWPARRQLLETEDREKARLLRNAPKPDATATNVAELEKELDVASTEREGQKQSS